MSLQELIKETTKCKYEVKNKHELVAYLFLKDRYDITIEDFRTLLKILV